MRRYEAASGSMTAYGPGSDWGGMAANWTVAGSPVRGGTEPPRAAGPDAEAAPSAGAFTPGAFTGGAFAAGVSAAGVSAAGVFPAEASTAEGARSAAVWLWPVFSSLATALLFLSGSTTLSALSDLIC